jgi:hypothetical protein
MHRVSALLLLLAAALPASAQPKPDAEAQAKTLAPFLDDQTAAIVHIDVTRIDLDALAGKLTALAGAEVPELDLPKRVARGWLDGFRKAGGRSVYVIVSIADLPGPPLLVVPVPDGAKVDQLAAAFQPFQPLGLESDATRAGVVVVGPKPVLQRVRTLKPSPFPDLAKALAAVDGTAVQVIVQPTPTFRQALRETMPRFPDALGGGPTTIITRDFRWLAVGVDLTPKLGLRVIAQTESDESARDLRRLAANALGLVSQNKEVQRIYPHIDKLTPTLTPAADGSRLTLTLDENQLADVLRPAVRELRDVLQRRRSMDNLHQIGRALHAYYDRHQKFPAPASYGPDGKPLLSWRVHLLPFLGHAELYRQFKLDEPWDSPHNQALIARMPEVYRGPNAALNAAGKTRYLAPVGSATVWPGPAAVSLADIKDGTAVTVVVIEAAEAQAVEWTKPDDWRYDPKQPLAGLADPRRQGFLALMADGSARFLDSALDPNGLRAYFTISAGDTTP